MGCIAFANTIPWQDTMTMIEKKLNEKKNKTCKSNFHPSSFKRAFFDISNMAHMATSAALPCDNRPKSV